MSLISIEISSWRDLNYNLPIQCAWKYKIYVNASAGQCSGRRLLHLHECKSGSVNDWVDWDEPPRRSFGFCFFFTKPPRRRYNTKLWCKDVRLTQKSQVLPLCEKTSQSSTDNEPAVHPWHSLTPSVRRHARWKKKKRGGGFLKCEIKFRTCTLLLNKHIKKTLQVKPWEHLRLKSMFYGSQG